MTDEEAFARNRWDWLVGKKQTPGFVIFSFDDQVRFAAKITSIENIPGSRRREIRGRALEPSHPVYTKYVNKPVPEHAGTGRNRSATLRTYRRQPNNAEAVEAQSITIDRGA